ncbi:MAG: hypothetical protein K1X77_09285 [Bacteroidia bacterium]|nr:hypothetical protein [Bacteroidia bacterium]
MKTGFTFDSIAPMQFELIRHLTGLLLTHTDRVPPHIGFCQNGIYYSLSNIEQARPQNLQAVIRLIERKKIPSVFVQLDYPVFRPSTEIIENILRLAPPIIAGGSCLAPVKGIVEEFWGVQVRHPLIHGLLDCLKEASIIQKVWVTQFDNCLENGNSYTIPFYNEQAVKEHLRHFISGRALPLPSLSQISY